MQTLKPAPVAGLELAENGEGLGGCVSTRNAGARFLLVKNQNDRPNPDRWSGLGRSATG